MIKTVNEEGIGRKKTPMDFLENTEKIEERQKIHEQSLWLNAKTRSRIAV